MVQNSALRKRNAMFLQIRKFFTFLIYLYASINYCINPSPHNYLNYMQFNYLIMI